MQLNYRPQREAGNILLITLITTVIMGISIASYMDLIGYQNKSVSRSQAWNASIAVIEAGVEEALTHLNTTTNLASENWTLSNGAFRKERTLGEHKVAVSITDTETPEIIAVGYVRAPGSDKYLSPPRAVRINLTNRAMFAKGIVAKGMIDLTGNNIKTDSFDSSDPNYSTGGQYDPAKAKDNGDVATNSGLIDSLNVGNADIKGRASTGPGGSVAVGANGGVGSAAWHAEGNHGIQNGWSSDDMNVDFPPVEAPFEGGAFEPVAGEVDGTAYRYIAGDGNYQLSSMSLTDGDKVLVTGDAVLYVTGEVSMSGNSQITIAEGASLKLYVAGERTSLAGNGIVNEPGNAMNMFYYGLPSNKRISMVGNAGFIGVIYAPDAHFTLGGGGSDTKDFSGASISGSVQMNGHFRFHYDENLAKVGPKRGFIITSWNEVNWADYDVDS